MPEAGWGAVHVVVILLMPLLLAGGLVWAERRLLALWQDRYGPNRVGPFGLLQVVADAIKLLFKEDWIPPRADRATFVAAPAIIIACVLAGFAVIPLAPGFVVIDLNVGLLFFLATSSLAVYSVALAGWSSGSKYSLLGGLRAAAQMLGYEVFMGISLMGVVMMAGVFQSQPHRRGATRSLVCGASVRGVPRLFRGGLGRDAAYPLRLARS